MSFVKPQSEFSGWDLITSFADRMMGAVEGWLDGNETSAQKDAFVGMAKAHPGAGEPIPYHAGVFREAPVIHSQPSDSFSPLLLAGGVALVAGIGTVTIAGAATAVALVAGLALLVSACSSESFKALPEEAEKKATGQVPGSNLSPHPASVAGGHGLVGGSVSTKRTVGLPESLHGSIINDDGDGQTDEHLPNACGTYGLVLEEVCDGVDNDCDGYVDEELLNACGTCGPEPEEVCDGVDNDCDGRTDEGLKLTRYHDIDHDGHGSGRSFRTCDSHDGVETGDDCNDRNPNVHPGKTETCNHVDDNCDGATDEGVLNACGTCGPVPEEVCDGVDNNCDGIVDENCAVEEYCLDHDEDGYGDPNTAVMRTFIPFGYVPDCSDCNDSDTSLNPSAYESTNDRIDNNCNHAIDETTVCLVNGQYETVAEAIEAAPEGSQIHLCEGDYEIENLSLNKSVEIVGDGRVRMGSTDRPILEARGEGKTILLKNITFSPLPQGQQGALVFMGVMGDQPDNITLENCEFSDSTLCNGAIIYSRRENITVRGCVFDNNDGASCPDQGRLGIFSADSTNLIVEDTRFSRQRHASSIIQSSQSSLTVTGTTMDNNSVDAQVLYVSKYAATLTDCHLTNNVLVPGISEGAVLYINQAQINLTGGSVRNNAGRVGAIMVSTQGMLTVDGTQFEGNVPADITLLMNAPDGGISTENFMAPGAQFTCSAFGTCE